MAEPRHVLLALEAREAPPAGLGAVVVVVQADAVVVLRRRHLRSPVVLEAVRAAVERPHLHVAVPPGRVADDVARELVEHRRPGEDARAVVDAGLAGRR